MRPKTIVCFEWIIFGTLLLSVPQSVFAWDRAPPESAVASLIVSIVVTGALALLVSRRRSKIAMWVLIALFVIGLVPFVQQMMTAPRFESQIISVVQLIGQGVAIGLLFTPSARRWMRREDEKPLREGDKLGNVFD